jgi:hypothetical protein
MAAAFCHKEAPTDIKTLVALSSGVPKEDKGLFWLTV